MNNKEKKNNSVGKVVTGVVGVVLLVALAFGGWNTTDVFAKGSEGKYKSIKVDTLTEAIFNRTMANTITGIDDTFYTTKKLDVSDMTAEYKGLIAERNYYSYINNSGMGEATVSVASVRYAYDSIFGAGTYKTGQKIYSNCYDFSYNRFGYYQDMAAGGCGGTTQSAVYPKVIKAEKSDKYLKVTAAVIYKNKDNFYRSYRDMEKTRNTLGTTKKLIGEDYVNADYSVSDEKIFNYVKKNQNKLEQYTKTFKIDTNGFYKYIRFERTKEAK